MKRPYYNEFERFLMRDDDTFLGNVLNFQLACKIFVREFSKAIRDTKVYRLLKPAIDKI